MATPHILPRHVVGGKFQQTLLEHLEVVKAQGARNNYDVTQRKHEALLFELGEAIRGLALDSLTLGGLITMQRNAGASGDEYQPGPAQSRFLANLGASRTTVGGPALLVELQYAAIDDFIAAMNERISTVSQREAARVRTSMRSRYETEVARVQDAEAKEKAKVAGLEARIAELEGDTEFLRARQDNGSDKPKKLRRKHVPSDPAGLYRSDRDSGAVVFEVKAGKNSWETFEDRDQAIARLAELRGEEANGNGAEPEKPKPRKPLRKSGILNPADLED